MSGPWQLFLQLHCFLVVCGSLMLWTKWWLWLTVLHFLVTCHQLTSCCFFPYHPSSFNVWYIHLMQDNVDLGIVCAKYYRVCCLSIIDPGGFDLHLFHHVVYLHINHCMSYIFAGDSDIIKSLPGENWNSVESCEFVLWFSFIRVVLLLTSWIVIV